MIWGAGSLPVPSLPPGSDWLLGFNEPNYGNQANLSPAHAAALWPQLEATGRRLVGPAMADCGEGLGGSCTYSTLGWYAQFLGNCSLLYGQAGCRLDAVALHLYYCSGQDMVNKLTALYELTLRPIWLTEFACDAPNSPAQPTSFAQSLLPRLESLFIVQRYSWFISYCAGCGTGDLLYDSLLSDEQGLGHLTQVGLYYSALQSTSATTVIASTNSTVSIDCGNLSPSVDGSGVGWLADAAFSISPSTTTPSTTAAIATTSSTPYDQYLYQTFRSGPVQYSIPVSAVGTYTVLLLFSEYQFSSVGQRVFGVQVQGVVVAAAYDIVRAAGASNTATSLQVVCAVTQSTGLQVVVQLTSGGAGVPLIAALQVQAGSAPTPSPPPSSVPSLFLSMSGSVGVDAWGDVWVSGLQFSSGGTVAGAVSAPIVGSPPSLVFIYNANLWGAFTIDIPVTASGQWLVTLYMAETYWSTIGQRVFSVDLQGVTVEPYLDIIARAGGRLTALNLTYTANVSHNLPYIHIQTHNIQDNALIAGIALQHIPTTPPNTQPSTSTPTTPQSSSSGAGTPTPTTTTSSTYPSTASHASSSPANAVASTGGVAPLVAGSLCFMAYGAPGNVDYPWSAATQLNFLFNPTPVTTATGIAVTIVSGSGSRSFTNRFGTSFSTQLTVSSSTANLLYLNQSMPLDSSGLTLTLTTPIQLPGNSPTSLHPTLTLRSVQGNASMAFIAEGSSSLIDTSGEAFLSTVPGFVNLTLGASQSNSLAIQYPTCQAPITFTNGLRQPTQPSSSNGAFHFLYSYFLSDGATYTVSVNLSITTSSQFAAADALGSPYQNITAMMGTRTYTWLATNTAITSTVTFPTGAVNRFYPYTLLASSPGVYSINTAPFLDASGLTFSISPSAPALGAAPGSGAQSSSIQVQVAAFNGLIIQLNEAAYTHLPSSALQQQSYTLQ